MARIQRTFFSTTNDFVFSSAISYENDDRDFKLQVVEIMDKIMEESKLSGVDRDGFIKCTIHMDDLSDLKEFDKVYSAYFDEGNFPTRTVYQLPELEDKKRISIEMLGLNKTSKLKKETIYTPDVPTVPNQSMGIKVGDYIFISSQSCDPSKGFEDQAKETTENIYSILKSVGADRTNILKNYVYLTDMNRFDDYNSVYISYYGDMPLHPARSCFGVSALPFGTQIEQECIAYTGTDKEILKSPLAPVFPLPFCQGVRAGSMIFISGQVGFDGPNYQLDGSFEGQVRQMIKNTLNVASMAGAKAENIIKCTIYLTSKDQFKALSKVYNEFFVQNACPSLSVYVVNGLANVFIVEMDSFALI